MGAPGNGKSDLALRLIDRGAALISDDAVAIEVDGSDHILLSAAPNIEGRIEVRNLGIVNFQEAKPAALKLVVDLDRKPERHPDGTSTCDIAGKPVSAIAINPFEGSAPIKVELALRQGSEHTG